MTPQAAMREYCKQCLNIPTFQGDRVTACGGDKAACGPCPFYPFRLKRVSVKIFRKNCLYSMGGRAAVENCTVEDCPCYPYQAGKSLRPRKGNPSALQKYRENGSITANKF